MRIKTYEAKTMQDALQQIKEELGPSALILNTRYITKGTKWFGLVPGQRLIEVVAGLASSKIVDSSVENQITDPISEEDSNRNVEAVSLQNIRNALDGMFQRQVEIGVNKELAQRLVYILDDIFSQFLSQQKELREEDVRSEFKQRLSQVIQFSNGLDFSQKEQQVIALVGPTGVGKTTTVAKLAAISSIMNHKSVGLISIDAYRIAAYDQLKTYAEIIGLPVELALSPQGARTAIDGYSNKDIIIVDSVGRSPNHEIHMAELHGYMQAIQPTEVHLTTTASVKFDDYIRIVDRYRTLDVNRLIFTKLDETTSLDTLVNGAYYTRFPLSYLGVGQTVPDDLEVADINKVAGFLLPDRELKMVIKELNPNN